MLGKPNNFAVGNVCSIPFQHAILDVFFLLVPAYRKSGSLNTLPFLKNFLVKIDQIALPMYSTPMAEDKLSIEDLLKVNIPNQNNIPNTIVTTQTNDEYTEPSQYVREVVTELNVQHLLNGEYSFEKLKTSVPELKELSSEQLKTLFKEVNKILEERRGLPPFEVKFVVSRVMDPQFVAACNIMMDVADKRSTTAKLKDVGLTTRQWNNMLRVKANKEFYSNLVDRLMDDDAWHESRMALARNVASGDLPSIKYMHELTAKFSPKSDFDPRLLTYMMTAILDIVVRHVDGNTARIIADEMEHVAIKELGIGTG